MSRIGKKPIIIPAGVTVEKNGQTVTVAGKLGKISRDFRDDITITVSGNTITLEPKRNSMDIAMLWGTYGAHLRNMISGVTTGFSKKLLIEGTGYRAAVSGKILTMQLGYSHDVPVAIPEGITVSVEKDEITIKGFDREAIGQFAAALRDLRAPEPYKGKGVRYSDEVIARKQGKKAVA